MKHRSPTPGHFYRQPTSENVAQLKRFKKNSESDGPLLSSLLLSKGIGDDSAIVFVCFLPKLRTLVTSHRAYGRSSWRRRHWCLSPSIVQWHSHKGKRPHELPHVYQYQYRYTCATKSIPFQFNFFEGSSTRCLFDPNLNKPANRSPQF